MLCDSWQRANLMIYPLKLWIFMDLITTLFMTLVLQHQKPLAVWFIQKGVKFTGSFTQTTLVLLVLWFDVNYKAQTETNGLTNTYKYMLTSPVMC